MTIPNLIFTTQDGIEVQRFYNKYVDSFGGVDYRDVYDSDIDKKQLDEIGRMMSDKPKTYGDYLKYVRENTGAC